MIRRTPLLIMYSYCAHYYIRQVDEYQWEHQDFLFISAAGNKGNGYMTIRDPATSKSGVAVGATLKGDAPFDLAILSAR